jgi:hypothetical protein
VCRLFHASDCTPFVLQVNNDSRVILGHRDIETAMRYAHLAPGHLREAVNRGSLSGTVTKTVTEEEEEPEEGIQPVDSMVRPEGLEPPTLGSEVRCSIQLSYGRARV